MKSKKIKPTFSFELTFELNAFGPRVLKIINSKSKISVGYLGGVNCVEKIYLTQPCTIEEIESILNGAKTYLADKKTSC